ncbi:diaminopimelate decarboxylase [Geomicrobium halophilum]|nr:diaminopimelate decarboxylase [Geomicrobium halophilum]
MIVTMKKRNEQGQLMIGNINAVTLTEHYGTPLYAYDVSQIRDKARSFKQAFEEAGTEYQVAYASKAFSCIAMVQLAHEEGLSLDVVSGGELYTAQQAGFPMERVHFHGNNKSRQEIHEALIAGIGCFVVDNFHEMEILAEETRNMDVEARILLRVTPGVEAHTHAYISTGGEDSKFGFDLQSGQADAAVEKALDHSGLHLLGVHCHIGSQIFETTGFVQAIATLYQYLGHWHTVYGFIPEVVNTGGGFGIRYTSNDRPLEPGAFVEAVVKAVRNESTNHHMPVPEIWIEPGRALVGEAGTTLYTIGSQKEIEGVRHYISVDGGMTDNIRPALYNAVYDAELANRTEGQEEKTYAIAGKGCESGDMLMYDLPLPEVSPGDILAVYSTGAYGFSMASNYNRLPRPPVVFVENERHQLVVERESYADLVRNDLPLSSNELR